MKQVWILSILPLLTHSESICQLCNCQFQEITPFIDCSSRQIQEFNGTFPREKLKQRTIDLDFENNDIEFIKIIPDIPVVRLSFRNNKILKIGNAAFERLVYLSYLDLSHNNLTELPKEVFKGPKKPGKGSFSPLRSLDLSFNKLSILGKTDFEYLFNLQEINLSGNPLKIVEDQPTLQAIGSLSRLFQLNLSETGITTLPRHFLKGLGKLQTLDVSYNKFDNVPNEIHYDGRTVEELILDGNPIDIIKSHSFFQMTTLKKLSICDMPDLEQVHEAAFAGLRNLTHLKMEHNSNLAHIDPDSFVDFQYPMVLEELSLSHNFLRYLPRDLLPELKNSTNTSLEVFKVDGNQWECDCHNEWLIGLLNEEKFRKFAKSAQCTRPRSLKGSTFYDLEVDQLPCQNEDSFDPRKTDFGLEKPFHYDENESRAISLGIAIGCILAILASILFVGILYIQQKRKIRYNQLSSFKIQFRRQTANSQRGSQTSLANSVYRDNPTTLPLE